MLTGDAFVSGNSAEERAKNFGADKKLVVGGDCRSFLQFDFSSLPAVSPGAVRKATLYLFARKVEMPGSIDIHRGLLREGDRSGRTLRSPLPIPRSRAGQAGLSLSSPYSLWSWESAVRQLRNGAAL